MLGVRHGKVQRAKSTGWLKTKEIAKECTGSTGRTETEEQEDKRQATAGL